MQETWVWSLSREDPLEKGMATHSSTLACKIPWMEEPGGLWGGKESDMTERLHFHFLLATAPWQISLDTVSEIMLSGFCSHPPGAHIYIWNESFNSQIQKRGAGGGVVGSLKSSVKPCPGINWKVQFSGSVMSDSLRPHGLQHPRRPCPSSTPRACSHSCPLSRWCHPNISSSVIPFFSYTE